MKPLFLLTLFALAATLAAAQYDELSDACSGQYLYFRTTRESGLPLQFVKCEEDHTWLCQKLNTGDVEKINPENVGILPLYADSDDFDIISFAAGYALPVKEKTLEHEQLYFTFCQLLKYRNSERGTALRMCLAHIDSLVAKTKRLLYKKTIASAHDSDSIRDQLDNSEAIKLIRNMISDLDFQLAFSCYCRLRINLSAVLRGRLTDFYQTDMDKILDDLEEELLKEYNNSRNGGQQRIQQFQACCPDVTGVWRQGSPTNLNEILQFAQACFDCAKLTLAYSEKLDFPNWGNAMLGVLQLLPRDELIPKQTSLFDECLKKYKEKYKLAD